MEIYIEEKDRLDASVAANAFTENDIRNRVYINTLGAELAIKYLASENIDVSDIYNIHSIKKIIEDIDISDIMLKNIHMDVRVVFDENAIFIPKSHFEYNIVPDIYLVFKQSQDYSEFLGFFDPKLINKNNSNSDYYFIEKEKLSSPFDLKDFVENFKGNTDEKLTEDEMNKCEQIIVSISDHETCDKKYLLEKLIRSKELREKFIEYENFESLSYKAMTDSSVVKKEINITEDTFESFDFEDDLTDNSIEEETDLLEDTTFAANYELESIEDELETTEEESETFDELENLETETVDELENLEGETEIFEEELENFENIGEETLSEELSLPEEIVDSLEEELPEIMSFEDMSEPVEQAENFDNTLMPLDDEIIEAEVLPDESYKELESIESLSENILDEEELSESIEDNNTETVEDILPDEVLETSTETFENSEEIQDLPEEIVTEEETTEPVESFGNNLLENLQAEEMDNVSIETFEDNHNEQEVSSEDLLSEIDNILTEIPNTPSQEISGHINDVEENIPQAVEETLEDIPDISELTEEIVPSAVSDEHIEAEGFNMDDLMEENNSNNELEVLHDEDQPQPDLPEEEPVVPGTALYNKQPLTSKKNLIIAAALIAVLAGGAFTMFKNNRGGEENFDITPAAEKPLDENMLGANTPDITQPQAVQETSKQPAKELKNTVPENKTPQAYMDVNRLVWDVPDSLSYSKGIQSYLRTAGKSIKLSLSADLLLATEFAYTNSVKVGLKISNTGSVQEAKILAGSGSTQIDNIVLQSVKDTLNVVKPPSGEVKTPDFNLNLIIYF